MSTILELTSAQLKRAADIKDQIDALTNSLNALLGSASTPVKTTGTRGPKKGTMSAAGRARIAAAQKARWAKFKSAKAEAPKAGKPARKRKMSAAGRARIIAAQKARWAKFKAAK